MYRKCKRNRDDCLCARRRKAKERRDRCDCHCHRRKYTVDGDLDVRGKLSAKSLIVRKNIAAESLTTTGIATCDRVIMTGDTPHTQTVQASGLATQPLALTLPPNKGNPGDLLATDGQGGLFFIKPLNSPLTPLFTEIWGPLHPGAQPVTGDITVRPGHRFEVVQGTIYGPGGAGGSGDVFEAGAGGNSGEAWDFFTVLHSPDEKLSYSLGPRGGFKSAAGDASLLFVDGTGRTIVAKGGAAGGDADIFHGQSGSGTNQNTFCSGGGGGGSVIEIGEQTTAPGLGAVALGANGAPGSPSGGGQGGGGGGQGGPTGLPCAGGGGGGGKGGGNGGYGNGGPGQSVADNVPGAGGGGAGAGADGGIIPVGMGGRSMIRYFFHNPN